MIESRVGRFVWLMCTSVQALYGCAESRNYSGPTMSGSGDAGVQTSGGGTSTNTLGSSSGTVMTSPVVEPGDQTSGPSAGSSDTPNTTGVPASDETETDAGSSSPSSVPDDTSVTSGDQTSSGEAPMLEAVHGRLIDFWGHAVPAVEVVIGEQRATTDDAGEFVIDAVGAVYDVSFVLILPDNLASFGYQFQHLTRRDPVLQVLEALPELEAILTATASGVVLDDDVDVVGVSFGSEDGNSASWLADTGKELSPSWSGPSETLAGFHAIHWRETDSLPTEYLGHFTDTVALTSGDRATLDVMLGGESVDMATISGTATGNTNNDRINSVYVTFDDGACIEVVEDGTTEDDEFSYLVPSLAGASLVVAASESLGDGDGEALAYKRGVPPGESDLALRIPTPATLEQPSLGATVTAESEFSWVLPGDNEVVVLRVEDAGKWAGMYIITDQPSTVLPKFDSYTLRSNQGHYWRVETHRQCATMDECAGEDGFWDPIGGTRWGIGKIKRDGSFTASLRGEFITE